MDREKNPPRKGLVRKLVYQQDNSSSMSSWQDYLYLAKYSDGSFAFFALKFCADWGDESPLRTKMGNIRTPSQFVRKFENISSWLESDDLSITECLPPLKKVDPEFFRSLLSVLVDEKYLDEGDVEDWLET